MADTKDTGPVSGKTTGKQSAASVGANRLAGRYPVEDERILALLERKRTTSRRRRRGWLMRRLLLVADMLGYVIAVAAIELLYGSRGAPDAVPLAAELGLFAIGLPAFVVGAKLFGLYDRDEERADHSTSDDLLRVFLLFTVGVFLMTRLPALAGGADPDLAKFTAFWALGIVVVTAAREAARAVGRHDADYLQNTIIVGAGDVGQLMARKVLHHPEYGLNLVGFVDDTPARATLIPGAPSGARRDLGSSAARPGPRRRSRHLRLLGRFARRAPPTDPPLRDAGVQVDLVPTAVRGDRPEGRHPHSGRRVADRASAGASFSLVARDQASGRSRRRLRAAGRVGAPVRHRGAAGSSSTRRVRSSSVRPAWAKGCASSGCSSSGP